jgi:hypothetical protein
MAQSLFSFNNYTLVLSSPPPLSSQIIPLSATLTGVTRVGVDYNFINKFSVKPFKVVLNWPGRPSIFLNDVYKPSLLDPLSTFSPGNSAYSFTVISPKNTDPSVVSSTINVYYENGVIHYYSISFLLNSDNVIDLDLDILNIQNTDKAFGTVFNLQSNTRNTVFNCTDISVEEKYKYIPSVDGYV